MKNKLLLFLAFLFFQNIMIQAQNDEILPRGFSQQELLEQGDNHFRAPNGTNFSDPPPGEVRTMAEWEELQGLVISWTGNGDIKDILEEIIRYAKEEVEVYIVCSSSAVVINQLPSDISLDNITFVETPFNSIWVRDYGPNTVYVNDVESPYMIDWIYNRNRPADDTLVPPAIAAILDIPIYETSDCDNDLDLVHTGGNFMNDGMGRAFSSNLVLDENSFPDNQYGCNYQTEADVLSIMNTFMGIDEYVFMENLIYDPIDHIDMHMKLLDEETLLVGEYPEGVADGPQIEANLQYVLSNYMTPYGRPYDVVRVPMPPDNGNFPDSNPEGDYRTYANAVFVNKTVLLPIYEEQYDTTAIRIWEEALPGYKIKGINCNDIIYLNGAIHCITKEVGVKEPLLINHSKVREGCMEQDQVVEATVQHKTGIAEVTLFYSTDTSGTYQTLAMTNTSENTWSAMIPATNQETEMFYYIQATANDGKQINRPLVAPQGYFHYDVIDCTVATNDLEIGVSLENVYPNPASAITVIPVKTTKSLEAEIVVSDILGRTIETIFSGRIPVGENNYFIHANEYEAGTYFVNLRTEEKIFVQKLIIQ